ncbi:MAG: GNAT family N-acetyltransferase [Gammaproteobacteria bacterium]|nr:GNAT family N-acetyltransferase [Gammaproteobacteria bacterium]
MIEIRAATQNDLPAITRLLASREELFLVYPKGRFPFTFQQAQQLYRERFEFTVIRDGDTIAGFANLYDRMQDKYAFIGNVFITPGYRRQGMGRLLLTYMIKAVFEKYDLQEARLSVFADNQPALALYQQFGFSTYSREQRLDPDNQNKTLLHMQLTNPDLDLLPDQSM